MKLSQAARVLIVVAGGAGALLSTACLDTKQNDFAKEQLQRHYENGEINAYQYEQGMRAFYPTQTPPAIRPPPVQGTASTPPDSQSSGKVPSP